MTHPGDTAANRRRGVQNNSNHTHRRYKHRGKDGKVRTDTNTSQYAALKAVPGIAQYASNDGSDASSSSSSSSDQSNQDSPVTIRGGRRLAGRGGRARRTSMDDSRELIEPEYFDDAMQGAGTQGPPTLAGAGLAATRGRGAGESAGQDILDRLNIANPDTAGAFLPDSSDDSADDELDQDEGGYQDHSGDSDGSENDRPFRVGVGRGVRAGSDESGNSGNSGEGSDEGSFEEDGTTDTSWGDEGSSSGTDGSESGVSGDEAETGARDTQHSEQEGGSECGSSSLDGHGRRRDGDFDCGQSGSAASTRSEGGLSEQSTPHPRASVGSWWDIEESEGSGGQTLQELLSESAFPPEHSGGDPDRSVQDAKEWPQSGEGGDLTVKPRSAQTKPASSVPWLLDDTVRDVLIHYADEGDVQMCVALCRVLGPWTESLVGADTVHNWFFYYFRTYLATPPIPIWSLVMLLCSPIDPLPDIE